MSRPIGIIIKPEIGRTFRSSPQIGSGIKVRIKCESAVILHAFNLNPDTGEITGAVSNRNSAAQFTGTHRTDENFTAGYDLPRG